MHKCYWLRLLCQAKDIALISLHMSYSDCAFHKEYSSWLAKELESQKLTP